MMLTASIILVMFISMLSELYGDNMSDKKRIIAEDYGMSLQQEFLLAQSSQPGYIREFEIYPKLEGYTYKASVVNTALIINYTEGMVIYKIPKVNGQLIVGINIIKNVNDTICLNC